MNVIPFPGPLPRHRAAEPERAAVIDELTAWILCTLREMGFPCHEAAEREGFTARELDEHFEPCFRRATMCLAAERQYAMEARA